MSNRCFIEFDDSEDISPTECSYGGSICDDEDDVSFCFSGPGGLLDRAVEGSEAAINELMGRIYMGCEDSGQSMMEFHWERGFEGPAGFPHLKPTQSINEASGIVFAEHAKGEMERDTGQPGAGKAVPRI